MSELVSVTRAITTQQRELLLQPFHTQQIPLLTRAKAKPRKRKHTVVPLIEPSRYRIALDSFNPRASLRGLSSDEVVDVLNESIRQSRTGNTILDATVKKADHLKVRGVYFVGYKFDAPELDIERETLTNKVDEINNAHSRWGGFSPFLGLVRVGEESMLDKVVEVFEADKPDTIELLPGQAVSV